MIGRLTGTLYDKSPPRIGLEVQGVGYEVDVSMTTFCALPEIGHQVTLLTHLTVREDAHILFGFATSQERSTFRELIKVTGIGARTALAVLSGMSTADLAQAVTLQEPARLTRVPGIGKKTAERLIVEMKDRFKGLHGDLFTPAADLVLTSPGGPATDDDAEQEAVAALVALGYKPQEASRMVSKIVRPDANSETLIREALRAAL